VEQQPYKSIHTFINFSSPDIQNIEFADYEIDLFSMKSPLRGENELNQDSSAIIRYDEENVLVIVADGVGGHVRGDQASRMAIETFVDEFNNKTNRLHPIREFILKCFDLANTNIRQLKYGSGTTLVVVHLYKNIARSYHVGDSEAFVIGDRGKLKYKTIAHSPTGFGIEAGLIDPEHLDHPERHIITNMLGVYDMRIEIGPEVELSKRDHIVVASDGLTDNFSVTDLLQKTDDSSFHGLCKRLVDDILKHFDQDKKTEGHVKLDDTTFITIRQKGN
jgi:serine/threonine protein phosphatase PrpC